MKRFMVAQVISAMLITASLEAGAAEPPAEQRVQFAPDNAPTDPDSVSLADSIRDSMDDRNPANSSTESSTEPVIPATTALAPPDDLWERIRNGFGMEKLDSEEVRNNEDFYVNQSVHIKPVVQRARRYLFHIVEEVERRGMPAEIALLPFIESAFDPWAYSRRHASGIWQLVPSTAKTYGLKQTRWYDERRDTIAATRAALDHLQNLHRLFGDWELALASYNCGQGAVGRSMLKNRNNGLPTDFRSIRLPRETQNYVPRLIALKNIISNPAVFGIELEPMPNQPYFAEITTSRPMDIKLAAKLANISVSEFKALNPAYKRHVINVDKTITLLLPADKVDVFEKNLKNYKPVVSRKIHKVKKAGTVQAIAKQDRTTERRPKEVNGTTTTRVDPLTPTPAPAGSTHSPYPRPARS